MTAVVAGRRRRYVLLNAPVAAVDRIAEVVLGLEAPTVVPLAEDGWVAVHSVVDADDVWNLLPELEAAGARGSWSSGSSSSSRDQPADQGRAGRLDDRAAERG